MTRIRRTGLAVVAVMIVAGCDSGADRYPDEQRLWAGADIDDYTLTYFVEGMAGRTGPIVVDVVDGEVVSTDPGDADSVFTVDDLFAALESADEVDATFDERFGYPTRVSIEPSVDVDDDEYGVEVVDFEPS